MDKFEKLHTFDDYLAKQLKDPEFKKEYDALEPEFEVMRAIMDARIEKGLTQQQPPDKKW